jgi:hypothetical protein
MQLAKSLGMSKVIVVVNKMDDRSIERTTKSRFTVLLPSLSLCGLFLASLFWLLCAVLPSMRVVHGSRLICLLDLRTDRQSRTRY